MAPESICAYSLGVHAAYRIESYAGVTEVPRNPYGDNKRRAMWDEGFSDGTDDLINGRIDAEEGDSACD